MLLAFTLALGACQASSTQPVVGTRSGVVAAGRDDLMSMKATAMINAVLYRYTIAWDRQGMSGVVDAITDCYRSAIMPGSEPQDVRNCLVLDMMAFRIDHQVGLVAVVKLEAIQIGLVFVKAVPRVERSLDRTIAPAFGADRLDGAGDLVDALMQALFQLNEADQGGRVQPQGFEVGHG